MSIRFLPPRRADTEKIREWKLSQGGLRPDGGLNVADLAFTLTPDQASKLVNLWFYEGSLTKRWGQRELARFTGGGESVRALAGERCMTGGAYVQSAGGLWHINTQTGELTPLWSFSGENVHAGRFFTWRSVQYFIGAGAYLRLDGASCEPAEVYVPTVLRSCSADGLTEGTPHEKYNRLTGRYRVAYKTDGTAKNFLIPFEGSVNPSVYIDELPIRAGYDYTFNASSGVVTLTNAPAAGTNRLLIEAENPVLTGASRVLDCLDAVVFGSPGRLMICAHGENAVFYGDIDRIDHIPEEQELLPDGDAPTGFGQQYDTLYLFQPNTLWRLRETSMTLTLISPKYGCDMPGSITTAGNRMIWCNTYAGVQILYMTRRDNESPVQSISRNIDPLLRAEGRDERMRAQGFDYDGRYFLCVGRHVYIWDYTLRPASFAGALEKRTRALAWFYFEGIDARAWFTDGISLLHATQDGKIVRHERRFDDFGEPIAAHYRSPMLDFGMMHRFKTICGVYIAMRSGERASADIKYLMGGHVSGSERNEGASMDIRSFHWDEFGWDNFLWEICGHFKVFARLMLRRRTVLFGLDMTNNQAGSDLSLTDITVRYRPESVVHDF